MATKPDRDGRIRQLVSSCSKAYNATAKAIGRASLGAKTASSLAQTSRVQITALFNQLGEVTSSLVTKAGKINAEAQAVMASTVQQVYMKTLSQARKVGHTAFDQHKKDGTKAPDSRNEMGKTARKGVSNRRRDFRNFLMSIAMPEYRDDALLASTPYQDGVGGQPTWAERRAIWIRPIVDLIAKSNDLVTVGWTNDVVPLLYFIKTPRADLTITERDGAEFTTLTLGSAKYPYEVEVRLDTMPNCEVYAGLNEIAQNYQRYVRQCHSSTTYIEDDIVPEMYNVEYQDN